MRGTVLLTLIFVFSCALRPSNGRGRNATSCSVDVTSTNQTAGLMFPRLDRDQWIASAPPRTTGDSRDITWEIGFGNATLGPMGAIRVQTRWSAGGIPDDVAFKDIVRIAQLTLERYRGELTSRRAFPGLQPTAESDQIKLLISDSAAFRFAFGDGPTLIWCVAWKGVEKPKAHDGEIRYR